RRRRAVIVGLRGRAATLWPPLRARSADPSAESLELGLVAGPCPQELPFAALGRDLAQASRFVLSQCAPPHADAIDTSTRALASHDLDVHSHRSVPGERVQRQVS